MGQGAELRHPWQNQPPSHPTHHRKGLPLTLPTWPVPTPLMEGPCWLHPVNIFTPSTNCIMLFPSEQVYRGMAERGYGVVLGPWHLSALGKTQAPFAPDQRLGERLLRFRLAYCPFGPSFPSACNPWIPPLLGPVKTVKQGMLISPPTPPSPGLRPLPVPVFPHSHLKNLQPNILILCPAPDLFTS